RRVGALGNEVGGGRLGLSGRDRDRGRAGSARVGGASMIPIAQPILGQPEIEAVVAVLRSGQLAQGEVVARLERRFAELVGARHAVAVSSGTAALHVALLAHGIGPGDEVITTPFSFVASA